MKELGIKRAIDDLGRFVIPVEVRKQAGLTFGAELEVFVEGDKIILKPCVADPDGAELARYRSCLSLEEADAYRQNKLLRKEDHHGTADV